MPRRRHRWDPICDPPKGLVRPVPIDPAGGTGPTRGKTRGKKWRNTTHGLYVPSGVDPTIPEQRVLEMSMLLPKGGAVTGWGACRLWLANFFDGLLPDGATERPVLLAMGPREHRRKRSGVTFSYDRLEPSEVVMRFGIPCARQQRALFDEMRTVANLREAVVAMDMMAAAQVTSIARTSEYLCSRERWNGVPQVRAALSLASEHSASPNETRMRLIWELDAKLPHPLANRPVFDLSGRLLGIADLLDPVAGVVGEFDGADHRGALRHSSDVDREAGFRDHDLEFFRVTGPDIPDRARVARRMLSSRSRAKWAPERHRLWTIEPPPGWEAELTLDEILDERDRKATLYAQYEREGEPNLQEVIKM